MCLSHLYSHFFLLIIDTDKWNGVNTRLSVCQLVYGIHKQIQYIMCWYFLVNVVKLTVYEEHAIPRQPPLSQQKLEQQNVFVIVFPLTILKYIFIISPPLLFSWGRRGRDRMLVGFTTIYAQCRIYHCAYVCLSTRPCWLGSPSSCQFFFYDGFLLMRCNFKFEGVLFRSDSRYNDRVDIIWGYAQSRQS